VMGFFRDRVSRTICPGWLRTAILLISASWVARTTSVSHWHSSYSIFYCYNKTPKNEYLMKKTDLIGSQFWRLQTPDRVAPLIWPLVRAFLLPHDMAMRGGRAWEGENTQWERRQEIPELSFLFCNNLLSRVLTGSS
jgi:hypothetical protein